MYRKFIIAVTAARELTHKVYAHIYCVVLCCVVSPLHTNNNNKHQIEYKIPRTMKNGMYKMFADRVYTCGGSAKVCNLCPGMDSIKKI